MRNIWRKAQKVSAIALTILLGGCGGQTREPETAPPLASNPPATNFTILAGSESKTFEPMLQEFARSHGSQLTMQYAGSVEVMNELESGNLEADAVWPANSLWIDLADAKQKIQNKKSIYQSPVVFGVKKSVAQRLGWIQKAVTVEMILQAAKTGKIRYMMTSGTQSNSGATAYLGYLYAFAGKPDVLRLNHLRDRVVAGKIKQFLGTVNRSSGSSGFLKELFLKDYDSYDGMVNYEAVIIETNQQLVKQGREPLYAVYPVNGSAIADAPLGYNDRGDAAKRKFFIALQNHLLSPPAQQRMRQLGRRTGTIGLKMAGADRAVFNPAWGIDTERMIVPVRMPEPKVIREALNLYQSAFRKPSLTVFVVDCSGSMDNGGLDDLKSALRMLLTPSEAKKRLLQAAPRDITVIIPFNDAPLAVWRVDGQGEPALQGLVEKVTSLVPEGGTNIYALTQKGFDLLKSVANLENYSPAVILMRMGSRIREASLSCNKRSRMPV